MNIVIIIYLIGIVAAYAIMNLILDNYIALSDNVDKITLIKISLWSWLSFIAVTIIYWDHLYFIFKKKINKK